MYDFVPVGEPERDSDPRWWRKSDTHAFSRLGSN